MDINAVTPEGQYTALMEGRLGYTIFYDYFNFGF